MKALTALNVVVTTQNEIYRTNAERLVRVIQRTVYEHANKLKEYGINLITTPDKVWFCKGEYDKNGNLNLKYIEPKRMTVTDNMITRHNKVNVIYNPNKPIGDLREELTEAFEKIEREAFLSVISDIAEKTKIMSTYKKLDHLVLYQLPPAFYSYWTTSYCINNKYRFRIDDYKIDSSTCSFFNYFIGKVEYNLDTNELVVYNQVSYFNPHICIDESEEKPELKMIESVKELTKELQKNKQ